jgi:hypothetical protein
VSSSESKFEVDQQLTYIHKIIETWERLFGVKPSAETIVKIVKVRELLKQGISLRKAIRGTSLGWKSFYKYASLIYLDEPDLLIPIPKGFLKQYIHIVNFDTLTQIRVVLNEVVKYAALELTWKLYRKDRIKPDEFGKKWYELAQNLLKTWIHELVEDTLFRNMILF